MFRQRNKYKNVVLYSSRFFLFVENAAESRHNVFDRYSALFSSWREFSATGLQQFAVENLQWSLILSINEKTVNFGWKKDERLANKIFESSVVRKELKRKSTMCLCLGSAQSGKTLLMKRLQGDEQIDDTSVTVPTNGVNLYTIKNDDGHFDMIVREIGGSMAPIWKHYFDKVYKILYVVDASNLCQISAAGVLLYSLLVEPKLQNAKIALVLAKMDFSYRQMRNEALLMLHFARLEQEVKQKITIIEASARDGRGIEEIRSWLFDPETLRKSGAPCDNQPRPAKKK